MKYSRIGTLKLETVFPFIREQAVIGKRKRVQIEDFKVNVFSLRLHTFLVSGTVCHSCGANAEFFAVEKGVKDKNPHYHLNLYGNINGEDILFTHDHKLAKCLGGKDDISNTQTMCLPCNNRKAHFEQDQIECLRGIRVYK